MPYTPGFGRDIIETIFDAIAVQFDRLVDQHTPPVDRVNAYATRTGALGEICIGNSSHTPPSDVVRVVADKLEIAPAQARDVINVVTFPLHACTARGRPDAKTVSGQECADGKEATPYQRGCSMFTWCGSRYAIAKTYEKRVQTACAQSQCGHPHGTLHEWWDVRRT
jgi:hypothetical protein